MRNISISNMRKSASIFILEIATGILFLTTQGTPMGKFYGPDPAAVSLSQSNEQEKQKPDDLITKLQKGNSDERQHAAIDLGTPGNKAAVEPLIRALSDSDNFVRSFAARSLGNIGDPRAVDALIKALDDEHVLVRRSAALALGTLRDARAVDSLIKALESEYFVVQRSAAQALGEIGDARGLDPLMKALESTDIYIQNSAALALAHIGNPALPRLVNRLGDWRTGPAVAGVLKDLNWRPPSDQETVLFDVAMRNKQALLDNWEMVRRILIRDANAENPGKVQNAVYALIGIGREEVVDELIGILSKKGNVEMARVFLSCGNDALSQAARSWARKHEVEFKSESENPIVEWGGMKKG